jgi:hypothetical protein
VDIDQAERGQQRVRDERADQSEQGEEEERVENQVQQKERKSQSAHGDQWADQAREERKLVLRAVSQEDVVAVRTVLRLVERLQAVQARIVGGDRAGAAERVHRQEEGKEHPGPLRGQPANRLGGRAEPGWEREGHERRGTRVDGDDDSVCAPQL